MCGIIGQINQAAAVAVSEFNEMRDTMFHRGPDDGGTVLLNNDCVALGHRRLSIIDLSVDGRQPMSNEDGTIWLTFNGEIYNYQELRKELFEKGHSFSSSTDSEVLIHGFEEWGIEGLIERIKGMFAFGIWDVERSELYLVRDRFGIKPLHYYFDDEKFLFASEIKAIIRNRTVKRNVSHSSLADFFIYSYIPHPKTIWDDIFKVPPAHYLKYSQKSHRFSVNRYWSLKIGDKVISSKEAVERANELIHTSVKQHLVSDVPVGLFLSGGYDSSTVLMHTTDLGYNLTSYSIGFENSERSEHVQAKNIATIFGSDHKTQLIQKGGNMDLLHNLTHYFDEPFAISSMIPYYQISEFAAKSCKVVLAGDGGDEAFAGYNWHYDINKYFKNVSFFKKLMIQARGERQFVMKTYANYLTGVSSELLRLGVLDDEISARIRSKAFWNYDRYYPKSGDHVKILQTLDVNTFIPEPCLTRADRASMAHSLEARVPFLDHEIFEFTFGLDTSVYLRAGVKKYLIHENLKKRLTPEILDMPKRGFSHHHLRELLSDEEVESIISNGQLVSQGLLKKNIKPFGLSAQMRFHLVMLELWYLNWNRNG